MKKNFFIVLIVGMLGWAVYEFALAGSPSEQAGEEGAIAEEDIDREEGLDQGDFAPEFELGMLDGSVAKLSDFRGKKVMLNFWATWCPPCRAEMPDMQQLYEDRDDVVVLAVNVTETESGIEGVEQFVDDFELTFPVALDEAGDVATAYEIQPIPTSFILDEEGRIQNKAIGPLNYDLMVQVFDLIK